MASVFLERGSDSSSADEPIEHDDQAHETNAEVECRPTYASFHDQMKNIHDVFQDLKNDVISSITVFENSIATLNAKEERFVKLSRKISSINFESAIKLNVGGHIYQTSLETLKKCPGSLLAKMFSACFDLKQGNDGCYFIDRDGTHFRHILNYLRSGTAPFLSVLKRDTEEILEEAKHYGLVGLVQAVNNKLNGDDDNSSENVKEEDEIVINSMVDEARKELCATEEKLKSFLTLLKANLKVLDKATNHHKELSKKLSNVHFGENVKIDVGGRIFKTSLKTVRRESESFLASMFSEKFDLKTEDDSFFIDRDGTLFQHILDYLRDGNISEDVIDDYGSQIQREAEFYGLSGLTEEIHNYNHVKLNIGGRDFVVTRETLKQYPESLLGRMLAGKPCNFKKRKDGSFFIEHDGTNFHHILEYLRYGIISEDVIKECGVSLQNDAKLYMLPGLNEQIQNYHHVKVEVGGREFKINRKVLGKFPESLFGRMLAGKEGGYVKRIDGSYFIEYDGTTFHHILSYLRSGTLSDGVIEKHSASLLDDAEYYMLPGLKERINNYHNVKMIIGTKEYVVSRKVLNKFPDSMFGKMLAGEEGDYAKKDDGSYCIKRDGSMFPHIIDYLISETLSDSAIGGNSLLSLSLLADAKFYLLPGLAEQIHNYHNIKMIIGDKEFVASRKMLGKFPESLFGRILAGKEGGYVKRTDGSYVIQYDGKNFHHILSYLRSGTLSDGVIEKHSASLVDDAEFYMLPGLKERIRKYDNVKMIIGTNEYVVSRRVLNKFPESMFGKMLAGEKGDYIKGNDGSYWIKHDGSTFPHILDYLGSGTLSDNVIEKYGGSSLFSPSLVADAEFYVLPGLAERIHDYHNINMIIGDHEFVVSRKMLGKFPESLFGRMVAGKEGGYVKRIDGSYFIQYDGTNFHHIISYLRSGTLSDSVIRKHSAVLHDEAEFYMLPGLKERINNYHKIKLNISGRKFEVNRRVLNKFEGSIFGKMLAGEEGDYVKKDDGSYWIKRDGSLFPHILDYLRYGTLSDNVIEKCGEKSLFCQSLHDDAEFYVLPGLAKQIHDYHNIRMIVDNKEFVVSREVLVKFPKSLFGKMLAGKGSHYVRTSDGSFYIRHDGTNFHHILDYLRSGTLSDDLIEKNSALFYEDAEFYMLPDFKERINNYYNVPIIIGARKFAVSRKVLSRFPDSQFGRMVAGEEGSYAKRNNGSYLTQYDFAKTFIHQA